MEAYGDGNGWYVIRKEVCKIASQHYFSGAVDNHKRKKKL